MEKRKIYDEDTFTNNFKAFGEIFIFQEFSAFSNKVHSFNRIIDDRLEIFEIANMFSDGDTIFTITKLTWPGKDFFNELLIQYEDENKRKVEVR